MNGHTLHPRLAPDTGRPGRAPDGYPRCPADNARMRRPTRDRTRPSLMVGDAPTRLGRHPITSPTAALGHTSPRLRRQTNPMNDPRL